MKISGVHWLLFAAVMTLTFSVGIVLADNFLEKRDERRLVNAGNE